MKRAASIALKADFKQAAYDRKRELELKKTEKAKALAFQEALDKACDEAFQEARENYRQAVYDTVSGHAKYGMFVLAAKEAAYKAALAQAVSELASQQEATPEVDLEAIMDEDPQMTNIRAWLAALSM